MILNYKVKPSLYRGRTKNDVIEKVTRGKVLTIGSTNGVSYTGHTDLSSNRNVITVFNLHKVRKKTIQKKGKDGKTKSTIVNENHWICYVYTFNLNTLATIGVSRIEQRPRNFNLIFKK